MTGEIISTNSKGEKRQPCQEARYKKMKFSVYDSGSVYLSGSLHYLFNDGNHNYNDFTTKDAYQVVLMLEELFSFDSRLTELRSVEIGVNIRMLTIVNLFLDNCFLHKTKPFEYKIHNSEGKYKQCEHSQYIIKLYNKALQFFSGGGNQEILRFEIKYNKMERLNSRGIYSLHDLIQSDFTQHKTDLLRAWDEILYFDNSIDTKSSPKLLQYNNPIYWIRLQETRKESFKKQRQELRKINRNSPKNHFDQIRKQIELKIDDLNTLNTQIDTLGISSVQVRDNTRLCPVTWLPIAMQKQESILLSHTGLKYYQENDPETYVRLQKCYLSAKWMLESDDVKIREIAHNIRNKFYNNAMNPNQVLIQF